MHSFSPKNQLSLLDALLEMRPGSSKNHLRALIKNGRVHVDGKCRKIPAYPVTAGSKVEIVSARSPSVGGVKILFEDKDLVIVDKPCGLLSVASEDPKEKSVHSFLKKYYHPNRVYVVHRLDKDASGVMLFTLSEKALWEMKELFVRHDLERIYLAIVEGEMRENAGTWTSYLKEGKQYNMISSSKPNDGEEAVTHFQLIKAGRAFSALQLKLETGKKHQIRVQCRDAGHPICGDKKYGSEHSPLKRLCLHSHYLSFVHPITGKQVGFESPLPPGFMKLINQRVEGA